ncbi:Protein of unknown function [Nonomuraea solani]|uniref:DUF4241 domain-containing protein n=1 Tax=Nonomuraea solani TaxID=1144553 RepID=A0A1H6EUX4_9ACTN|nr:DUF4241 domain-containing protein [Nonomuraea solani]SEH00836.1 Protein of unknown function [Nonomuraea solani]
MLSESGPIVVVYCEGWEPVRHAVVGPLPPDEAQRRDETGEQYAALLFLGDRVRALFEVVWRQGVCVTWGFDDQRRRVVKRDFRRLADELLLVEQVSWGYPTESVAEFGAAARQTTVRHAARQGYVQITAGHPGHSQSSKLVPVASDRLRLAVPCFGDWAGLAFFGADQIEEVAASTGNAPSFREYVAALAEEDAASSWLPHPLLPLGVPAGTPFAHLPPPDGVAVVPFDAPVWQPPQPLRVDQRLVVAHPASSAASPGARLESRQAGTLRVPTGELVACDPYTVSDAKPFTMRVPPGRYPMMLTVVGEGDPAQGRVAAAWLVIDAAPVISWELATRPGEDVRTLPDGEAFYFAVDAGMACFVDRAAVDGLAYLSEPDSQLADDYDGNGVHVAEVDEPTSGANLIAFSSGWGDGAYPVWIGRTEDDGVACVMADMLVLGEPEDVPTIPPETVPSTFAVGDAVMLADGPFASLPGTVKGIDVDGRMLTVALSIFGRDHDIEAPFHQVEKL